MPLHTPICDLLGIEYPILQGGMAWSSTAPLAAAVSEAGGLGILGSGGMTPDVLQSEIKRIKTLTDKPFGVNLMLLRPDIDEQVRVVLEDGVRVLTTGAGNPGRYIKDFKANGSVVIPLTNSVALANRLEDAGVDAIIAEGMESGGHVGELSTLPLVPQIVDAMDIPVIAAGGIADGRGIAAALALGAQGVQIGTLFLCTPECEVHPAVKEKILKAKDRDTTVTGRITGHPVRIVKNRLAKEINELEKAGDIEAIERLGSGALRRAMSEGDVQHGSLMAGESSGMVREIRPAGEILAALVRETQEVISGLQRFA